MSYCTNIYLTNYSALSPTHDVLSDTNVTLKVYGLLTGVWLEIEKTVKNNNTQDQKDANNFLFYHSMYL